MPLAIWPIDVPLRTLQSGYSEAPEKNTADFQPEVGPPKTRRRTSISSDVITCSGNFSSEEWDALVAFYRTTLADGSLPFTRAHPRSGLSMTFKFTGDPPKLSQVRGDVYTGSFGLRRMP
ncbi:hypothetical protein [Bradyrhizobium sp. G127]|uniref:hypothetical protein n=1 Tax=Bradyrhizobium sp. G127 TaxID=2904800 RepID=UPI001F3916E5|nr:hypothetical protein [Bradyrhizobium sp. G127]MCF2522349.1 hypothetical protein [Bradyrhizobium sp. G127]